MNTVLKKQRVVPCPRKVRPTSAPAEESSTQFLLSGGHFPACSTQRFVRLLLLPIFTILPFFTGCTAMQIAQGNGKTQGNLQQEDSRSAFQNNLQPGSQEGFFAKTFRALRLQIPENDEDEYLAHGPAPGQPSANMSVNTSTAASKTKKNPMPSSTTPAAAFPSSATASRNTEIAKMEPPRHSRNGEVGNSARESGESHSVAEARKSLPKTSVPKMQTATPVSGQPEPRLVRSDKLTRLAKAAAEQGIDALADEDLSEDELAELAYLYVHGTADVSTRKPTVQTPQTGRSELETNAVATNENRSGQDGSRSSSGSPLTQQAARHVDQQAINQHVGGPSTQASEKLREDSPQIRAFLAEVDSAGIATPEKRQEALTALRQAEATGQEALIGLTFRALRQELLTTPLPSGSTVTEAADTLVVTSPAPVASTALPHAGETSDVLPDLAPLPPQTSGEAELRFGANSGPPLLSERLPIVRPPSGNPDGGLDNLAHEDEGTLERYSRRLAQKTGKRTMPSGQFSSYFASQTPNRGAPDRPIRQVSYEFRDESDSRSFDHENDLGRSLERLSNPERFAARPREDAFDEIRDAPVSRRRPSSVSRNRDWVLAAEESSELLRAQIETNPHARNVSRDEAKLRLQEAVLGNTREATRPIKSLDVAERNFMANMTLGLSAFLDENNYLSETDRRSAVLHHMNEACKELAATCPMKLRNMHFVSDCKGFGQTRSHEGSYRSSEMLNLYIEMDNPTIRETATGYETRVVASYEIRDKESRVIQAEKNVEAPSNSASRKRDHFLCLSIQLKENLAPGPYTIRVAVCDRYHDSHQTAEEILGFQIVAGSTNP